MTIVTHQYPSDHRVAGRPHHEQVGFGDLGQLVQAAANRPGTPNDELRVDPCQLALSLKHLLGLRALDLKELDRAAPGERGANVREREGSFGRSELPGQGDRVATALPAINPDENVAEHAIVTSARAIASWRRPSRC